MQSRVSLLEVAEQDITPRYHTKRKIHLEGCQIEKAKWKMEPLQEHRFQQTQFLQEYAGKCHRGGVRRMNIQSLHVSDDSLRLQLHL